MNQLNHVAIIMDGNGRWGLKKKNSRNYGHLKGLKTVERIIKFSAYKKIPFLTLYTFSTENWKRPKREINFLFKLIDNYFFKEIKNLIKNSIKINIIGNIKVLPTKVKSRLYESMRRTKKCNKMPIISLEKHLPY